MFSQKTLLYILIFSIIIIIGLFRGTEDYFQGFSEIERGTFGDMYGSVNALFSGLVLAGIVYTILLQRNELSIQHNELESTRKEFIKQNDTLRLQRFENTFFNLLSLHHQIVSAIDIEIPVYSETSILDRKPPRYKSLYGRDVFKKKYEELVHISNNKSSDFEERKYFEKYEEIQTDFGHYFRNLYRMFKMVDEAYLIDFANPQESLKRIYKSRYKYTSIIRSQLSDYELLWLFYNCLSSNGKEQFKPLIERYTIFKNIPIEKLIHKKHKGFYEITAYEKDKKYWK